MIKAMLLFLKDFAFQKLDMILFHARKFAGFSLARGQEMSMNRNNVNIYLFKKMQMQKMQRRNRLGAIIGIAKYIGICIFH